MGLGLNGGGLAATRFLVEQGAEVTVTDLRTDEELRPSLDALADFPVRFVLGRHEESDFEQADLVVKNPAVRAGNPFLRLAKRVETDLSLFLKDRPNPLLAVTGSKGKSTTVSALHHILLRIRPDVRLGGNITVSPLTFLKDLATDCPIILELSSWQLADLKGKGLLKPKVAAISNLLWDHMNAYSTQEEYATDKAVLLENLQSDSRILLPSDSSWGTWFSRRSSVAPAWIGHAASLPTQGDRFDVDTGRGQWKDGEGVSHDELLLPESLKVPGLPFRRNCLAASAMAVLWGVPSDTVRSAVAHFSGVEHRMEHVATVEGVRWYNDTAATIPEAAVASAESFDLPLHWILGGTDKNLDLSALETAKLEPSTILLLKGSATDRMIPLLKRRGWPYHGPFGTMAEAVKRAAQLARPNSVVLLSPGAASFELFRNEFYRGQAFRDEVAFLKGARG